MDELQEVAARANNPRAMMAIINFLINDGLNINDLTILYDAKINLFTFKNIKGVNILYL